MDEQRKSLSLWKLDEQFVDVIQRLEECEGVPDEALEKEMDEVFAAIARKEEGYLQAYDSISVMIEQGKQWVERFNRRIKTLQNAQERMKKALLDHMNTVGTDVIETELGKIRKMKSESVVVDNLDKIPGRYVRIITDYKPDKTAIKKAIKDGTLKDGAHIEEKEYVRIYW